MNRFCYALLSTLVLLGLAACDDSDSQWDTSREALGGLEHDSEQSNARWTVYRDQIVEGLDLMRDALSTAREDGTFMDRDEIDALTGRVSSLRREMASELEQPPDPDRRRLRETFESVRTDVDALLTRLGYDPDEIARWQDKS